MTNRRPRNPAGMFHRRIVTTLGDLISAAYEASDGFGTQRLERAAELLERSPLKRRLSRHLVFVR